MTNDTTMTLQIPIGKVVTLGGNTAPQRTTFTFNATPSNPEYGRNSDTGLWDVRNCTVSANGEGTFNCVMTIRIEKEDFHFLTDKDGIIITETDDEQPGWTYDETRWFLQPHYEWNENIHEYEWTGGWDAMLGEVTPRMAVAVGQSAAKRILIPVNHCANFIAGVADMSVGRLVDSVVAELEKTIRSA